MMTTASSMHASGIPVAGQATQKQVGLLQDALQVKLVTAGVAGAEALYPLFSWSTYLRFYTLFHPHVCEMVRRLNGKGIAGLLSRELQERTNDPLDNVTLFEQEDQYDPSEFVHHVYPRENVDFD